MASALVIFLRMELMDLLQGESIESVALMATDLICDRCRSRPPRAAAREGLCQCRATVTNLVKKIRAGASEEDVTLVGELEANPHGELKGREDV
ncbi:hypothetical protein PGQ11_014753 [Apiospora arundinis]|uniref:Uncharacterized protein n=1 Tax=Apiospora arundinis TaxID=335852 RepID=A0ABR2HTU2_9PEZI